VQVTTALNLLAEIKTAYLLHRLTCSETAPSGSQILHLATRGGAALLGRSDIGSLEVGKAAELVYDSSRFTGECRCCG